MKRAKVYRCAMSASSLLTGAAIWWMMAHIDECSPVRGCSECIEKCWSPMTNCNDDPGVSRGPHVQCSQPSNSLTPQQEAYWRTVRRLPGIQLRVTANGNFWQGRNLWFIPLLLHSSSLNRFRLLDNITARVRSAFALFILPFVTVLGLLCFFSRVLRQIIMMIRPNDKIVTYEFNAWLFVCISVFRNVVLYPFNYETFTSRSNLKLGRVVH